MPLKSTESYNNQPESHDGCRESNNRRTESYNGCPKLHDGCSESDLCAESSNYCVSTAPRRELGEHVVVLGLRHLDPVGGHRILDTCHGHVVIPRGALCSRRRS